MKAVLVTAIIVCGILGLLALLTGNLQGIALAIPGLFYFVIQMAQ